MGCDANQQKIPIAWIKLLRVKVRVMRPILEDESLWDIYRDIQRYMYIWTHSILELLSICIQQDVRHFLTTVDYKTSFDFIWLLIFNLPHLLCVCVSVCVWKEGERCWGVTKVTTLKFTDSNGNENA